MQQQRGEAARPVPVPARRGISDNRSGNWEDGGMQAVHDLLSVLQLRQDHQAGRNQAHLLHGRVLKRGQREALHQHLL